MYNICIGDIQFEWDESKDLINQAKHGVSFNEALTVFFDDDALLEYDKEHSGNEERFRILGISVKGNLLLVVHCVRNGSVIRIISSRKGTSTEKKGYERSLNV
jgi:uncharacterized DUF497 family protein